MHQFVRALTAAVLVPACALSMLSHPTWSQDRNLRGQLDFKGRYIVSVSDADMVASAYVNGRLGPIEGKDALSVIPLQGDPRDWKAIEINASNSVAGPPAAVDITKDGRFAFVVETWTPRPGNTSDTFKSLKFGNKLTVIDLSDPARPRIVDTVTTAARPDAVRVKPDGSLIAVTFHPAGAGNKSPLALYRFKDGKLSDASFPVIEGWSLTGGRMIDLDWHPTEPVVAIIDGALNTVRFAKVSDDLKVTQVGNTVDIERTPFRVFFTPDGRHIVINALYWGSDIAGRWIEAPRGSVLTVRMNAATSNDGKVRHAFVSRVMTGVSPEGLAVSPDGRWVATTNLERSYLPYDDKRITWFSSITLARLDPESGQLSRIGDFNYDGILPEAAAFDNSSSYLAVANYDHFDDRKQGGSIDFWRIQADPLEADNVQLVKTEHSVKVMRGAHSMVIAR